jgi:hypothetical protein
MDVHTHGGTDELAGRRAWLGLGVLALPPC